MTSLTGRTNWATAPQLKGAMLRASQFAWLWLATEVGSKLKKDMSQTGQGLSMLITPLQVGLHWSIWPWHRVVGGQVTQS